ncbi:FkbM family methyltransferase [Okeania sp. SIO2B3]|uniref:FkbM family methyltransferase n=1 Tax=Okeania sp. SIO2B3 TaxID=2607784 RepID=UPI0013BF05CD|nr:FkbM family methyltransferase [Okeania sp. SIO2B3]NET44185.1 FkbM family methyltransferase [Okeania sp. SIO2B3]
MKATLDLGELNVIARFIRSGNVVFDVGAYIGQWTDEVFKCGSDRLQIHSFEPHPQNHQKLVGNLAQAISLGQVVSNNFALSNSEEIKILYDYQDTRFLNTLYRRNSEDEKLFQMGTPRQFPILLTTLDAYCQRWQIKRINFLKIDVEGSELDVLKGATKMLQSGKIDYLQFEYGNTFKDAGISLKAVFEFLQQYRYSLFKILPNQLDYKPEFLPADEDWQWCNFLAVNERFISGVLGQFPQMFDLAKLCSQNSIQPRGVIHIGAYEGEEIKAYREMGMAKVLFVEANPQVFDRLQKKMAGMPEVRVANYALCERNGLVDLHIAANEQSSSILSPKDDSDQSIYTREISKVTVEAKTLDSLLAELELPPEDFNLLNIDIQGAELLALQGATNALQFVDGINIEVNYEEIYQGCPLIDDIDEFLEKVGFDRVATTTPYHHSWGDAFYVKKPTIIMSTLGKNGGFANQLFQYGFLKIYAKEHNLRVETPEWIGKKIFGLDDPLIRRQLPVIPENIESNVSISNIVNSSKTLSNVDFWGYFQYHTAYYAKHQEYWRSLFQPVEEIQGKMQVAWEGLRAKGKTIVAIHLRLGDYFDLYPHWIAPWEWYGEWLRGFWETLEDPILYVASDDVEKVLGCFAQYQPITAQDLGVELPEAEFYPDFYVLSHADAVAISNSTFSFAASMLNQQGKFFCRPHFPSQKLISFDPWNSLPLFR